MFPGDDIQHLLGEDAEPTKTFRAYRPGDWKLQATVTFSNGKEVQTNVLSLKVMNPLHSKISSSLAVIEKMNALWAAAVNLAKNQNSYREKGCWILFNTTNNAYEFRGVPDSPELACEGTTSISFPGLALTPKYPNVGATYIVGTFHTHPARTKCSGVGYKVGPSGTDMSMPTVCLLYDYVGVDGTVSGRHSPTAAFKLYHCALDRHPVE